MDIPKRDDITGSSKLVAELQAIFTIYASDLRKFREGGAEFELLGNTEMFDIVVKLLNVSDKIKKLDNLPVSDAPTAQTKVANIQDLILNGKK
jgi:hypothetical protein